MIKFTSCDDDEWKFKFKKFKSKFIFDDRAESGLDSFILKQVET